MKRSSSPAPAAQADITRAAASASAAASQDQALDRRCACGQHTGGGECRACGKGGRASNAGSEEDPGKLTGPEAPVFRATAPGDGADFSGVRTRGAPAADRRPRTLEESLRQTFDEAASRIEVTFGAACGSGGRGALGSTRESHVRFQASSLDLRRFEDRFLLGHEVAHAIQQRRGGEQQAFFSQAWRNAAEAEADRAGLSLALGHRFQVTGHAPRRISLYSGTRKRILKMTLHGGRGLMLLDLADGSRESVPLRYNGKPNKGSYTWEPRSSKLVPDSGTPNDRGYVFVFWTPLDAEFDVPDKIAMEVVDDGDKIGHRIQAQPEQSEVEPGATVKYYVGTDNELWANYSYRWWCENDPSSVFGDRKPIVDGPMTRAWDATWSFAGLHTVVCELTTPGTGKKEQLRFVQKVWDWRQSHKYRYDDIANQVRQNHQAAQDLLRQQSLSDADFARLNRLYERIDALVLELRQLGFREPDATLLERIVGGKVFDSKVNILGIRGAELAPGGFLYWGERRRFDLDLDWIPPNVPMFVEWFVEGIDGEWAAKNMGAPPAVTRDNPTGSLTLDEDAWMGPVGMQVLAGRTDSLRIVAKLKVGKDPGYEAKLATAWIPVKVAVPKSATILANGLQEMPVAGPSPSPATPPPTPTTGTPAPTPSPGTPAPAPAVERLALARMLVEFRLSWIAPPVGPRDGGFKVEWLLDPPPPASRLGRPLEDPFRPVSFSTALPGQYTVYARVRPGRDTGYGITTTKPPVLETSLSFRVVSSDDLAAKGLAALKRQGVGSYASTMKELDQQIADVDEMRRRGSPAQRQLDDRREGLAAMRTRMSDELGAAPQALPATGPLDTKASYVFPLPAVMAVPEARGVVPLRIFVRLAFDEGDKTWRARLVDTTTRDVVHFEESSADPVQAVRSAIDRWSSKNEYPQNGTVSYEAVVLTQQVAGKFSTSSTKKTFWEWFDRILFIGQALLALLLLLVPEPTGATKAAGLALLAVGVLRGVYRLYESLSLGRPLLDERNVLEALSILAAALGLAGGGVMGRAASTALKGEALSARALAQFQLGKGIALTAVGVDAGTFVWVAGSAFAQMQAVANDTSLPEAERNARLQKMMLDLAAQGLLLIGTNAQLFGHGAPRGTRAPMIEKLGELNIDPVMRSRMETTLRRLGATDDLTALEPRALLDRYVEAQRARAQVATDVDVAGGVRGQGVYDPAPADARTGRGPQTAATVHDAAKPFGRRSPAPETRLENLRTSGDLVTADLVVEVPATGSKPADTLTAKVTIEVLPSLDPSGGTHGPDSGMARLSISGDPASGWRVHVEMDSRIANAGDVRHHLSHEIREAADIIKRASVDPKIDIKAESQPRVFGPAAATGDPSSHDRAAAQELGELHAELQRSLSGYDTARGRAAAARGAPIDPAVRQAGEAAYRRLDAMLDAMGFADPNNRATKRAALFKELAIDDKSPLATYIDGYAARAQERIARTGAVGRMDPTDRARLAADLPLDLMEYVNRRLPAPSGAAPGTSPVEVIGRVLGRNNPANNGVRNLVREAIRQHRAGRFNDAALAEVLNLLDGMSAQYGDRLATNAAALRAVQMEGPNAAGALRRLEKTIVEAGISSAPAGSPAGTPAVRYHPEAALTDKGLHGVNWTEADARKRSVDQLAEDTRLGRVRAGPYDQGKFGTLADVNYAVECARQQLGPPGNVAGLPDQGAFRLPAGHGNVVYRPGVANPVVPDVIYVAVAADGSIHAYPADSAVLNMAGLGAIRAVVTW